MEGKKINLLCIHLHSPSLYCWDLSLFTPQNIFCRLPYLRSCEVLSNLSSRSASCEQVNVLVASVSYELFILGFKVFFLVLILYCRHVNLVFPSGNIHIFTSCLIDAQQYLEADAFLHFYFIIYGDKNKTIKRTVLVNNLWSELHLVEIILL